MSYYRLGNKVVITDKSGNIVEVALQNENAATILKFALDEAVDAARMSESAAAAVKAWEAMGYSWNERERAWGIWPSQSVFSKVVAELERDVKTAHEQAALVPLQPWPFMPGIETAFEQTVEEKRAEVRKAIAMGPL